MFTWAGSLQQSVITNKQSNLPLRTGLVASVNAAISGHPTQQMMTQDFNLAHEEMTRYILDTLMNPAIRSLVLLVSDYSQRNAFTEPLLCGRGRSAPEQSLFESSLGALTLKRLHLSRDQSQIVAYRRYLLTITYLSQHNENMTTSHERILLLAAQRGLIRPRDLAEQGLSSVGLTRLVRQGLLSRVGRGLYAIPGRSTSEFGTLAEVAHTHPQTIVCLLSALRIHNLTTQSPFEVWIAIPNKARAPKIDYPPVRVVRFSGGALTEGIEDHLIEGVTVRVTNIARTVADCFQIPK